MNLIHTWFDSIDPGMRTVLVSVLAVLALSSIAFRVKALFPKPEFQKELIQRTNSWVYIVVGVVVVTTFPLRWGSVLMAIVSYAALREMFSISPLRASDRLALFLGYLAIPVQYYSAHTNNLTAFFCFIPLGMFVLIPVSLAISKRMERVGTSMTMIPSLLILSVYMPSHLILLNHLKFDDVVPGGGLILFVILLTAFNDVFQFTWGKLIGKRKLIPVISPSKTVEGFVGGVLTTVVLAILIRFLTPFSILTSGLLGLMIGVLGFVGDAIVSAIKRDLRIKDTGQLIPGHGGAMDRLDSLIFTCPFFFHAVYQLSLHQV